MISPELLAVLITIATAIAGAFGLYFKGKSKGKAEVKAEVELQKKAEVATQMEIRVDTMKVTKNAQAEVDRLPAGAASERLHDEFSRDS